MSQALQNPVGWFELYVKDMPRARKFYETVFDITLEKMTGPAGEMWMFPRVEGQMGATGALICMDHVPSGPGGTLIYFSSEDCAVEEARVAEAGGRVFQGKMSIGTYGFICIFIDTEENMIGVHSNC